MTRSVLLIEDQPEVLQWLERLFQREGWQTIAARSGEIALERLQAETPDVILQDLRLPGLDGLALLRELLQVDPDAAVIIITGHGDIATAVDAMQSGAEGFLTKPLDVTQLLEITEDARMKVRTRREKAPADTKPLITGLESLGESPAIQALVRQAELVASTNTAVLIQGETGTGKSWLAKQIHDLSPRAAGPFVEINCGSLAANLLESELFGHEKGAFTDAKTQKRGLLEIAEGGTLFLDEIGDLAVELQPKLLTVLETRRYRRLGGTAERRADVRIIAATHRPLEEDVEEKRFREDLYYRISVLPLRLPPLRERSAADLVAILQRHLQLIRTRVARGPAHISPEALTRLLRHRWPGNLREMRNVLEWCLVTYPDEPEILPEHLPPRFLDHQPSTSPGETTGEQNLPLEEVEKRHIIRVLELCNHNRTEAARALGIGRRTLYDKLKRYGL